MTVRDGALLFAYGGGARGLPDVVLELYRRSRVFRDSIDATGAIAEELLGWNATASFRGTKQPPATREAARRNELVLQGMTMIGLTDRWRAEGVTPDAVVSVSLGECVAPYAAGAISRDDCARLVTVVAQAISRNRSSCRLYLLATDEQTARRLCRGAPVPVDFVGTSSRAVALALSSDADTETVRAYFGRALLRDLPSDWRYHTPAIDVDLAWMRDQLRGVVSRPAAIPMYSAAAGGPLPRDTCFDAEHLIRMLRSPMLFADAVAAALADGFEMIVQLAARPKNVAANIDETAAAEGRPVRYVDSLDPDARRVVRAFRRPGVERAPTRATGDSAASVLSVAGLSKKYCRSLRRALWYGVQDIAREVVPIGSASGLRRDEFWAVDDVSFELQRGEALAVIGSNGAGKSTLLKMLAGLLKPDRGQARLRGSVEALIELGTGFNPLLTGAENVRVGAALHGVDRRATEALLEKVVDFAELGEFLDAPLQSYSSGMRARLAYALAANLEPDVLMVDEALAVGDAAFQRKCAAHMLAYLDSGGALLLVSHNTYQVQSMCERGILLDRGKIVFRGSAVEALNQMLSVPASPEGQPRPARRHTANSPVVIEAVAATAVHGDTIHTGEPVRITVRYRAEERVGVLWGFGIWTADQWVHIATELDMRPRMLEPGAGELTCVVPRLPLVGSRYALRAVIVDAATRMVLDLYGFFDAPQPLEVRSEASVLANAQIAANQLVTIDVDWE